MNSAAQPFVMAGSSGQYLPKEMVFKLPEDDRVWVRRPAGHLYLPLLFDLAAGVTVNILRYPKPGVIGRHVHDGPVYSYTIEGAWHYPEHDWVATPGTFIWEPPGEVHTLVVDQSMMAFYVMHGGLVSVDEQDRPIRVDNALTLLEACDQYYREIGFGPEYVQQFIR